MTRTDRRARRGDLGHLVVALAGLGEAGRDTALEVGDDVRGRVPVKGRVGCRARQLREVYARANQGRDVHQVLASGSSMAGSTLRRLTLRMKP